MSSRRLASVLGPVIVLLLIGGITAAVLGGPDRSDDTDLASEPTELALPDDEPTDPQQSPAQSDDGSAVGSPTEDPADPPTPEAVPSADPVGSEVAVQDPTELTGGWEGGTPNTGTAVSAAGLLLLAIAGGLLWLRRSRA